MRLSVKFLKIFFISLSFSLPAYSEVKFVGPITSSFDCHTESIVTTISPDNSAVSVLLNGTLFMELPPATSINRPLNKRCVINIPLEARPKEQYVFLTHDWRLYANIPEKAKLDITSKIWMSREVTRKNNTKKRVVTYYTTKTKHFKAPFEGDFIFNQRSPEPRVSECGKAIDLTLEFNMKLRNNSQTETALVDVDSYDLAQMVGTTIVRRDCE
jgi:hypothetical protein